MRNLLIVVSPFAEELLAVAGKNRTGPAQDASRPSFWAESLRTEGERTGSPCGECNLVLDPDQPARHERALTEIRSDSISPHADVRKHSLQGVVAKDQ